MKKDLKLSDDDFECAVFDLLLAKCQTKYRIILLYYLQMIDHKLSKESVLRILCGYSVSNSCVDYLFV